MNASTSKNQWSVSDISAEEYAGEIKFEVNGEFHHFHIIVTPSRVVFGGACNAGFLESGYMEREEYESIDESLQECLADIETYYQDGPQYVSRIVCNERM